MQPDEDLRLRVTIDSDTKGAAKAGKALDDTADSADKATKKLKTTSKSIKEIDSDLEKLYKQRGEIARRYSESEDKELLKDRARINKRIGLLKALKAELVQGKNDGEGPAKGLFSAFGKDIPTMPAVIGLAAPIALALAPAIGAGIAGAVGGAGVAAGIAGGIFAASKSQQVRDAAKDFGGTLSAEFFGAGGSFVKPVQESLAILGDDVKRLDLEETFARAAPGLTTFAGGLGDLVGNLMPGFNRLLDDSEPYAEALAEGLGETGDALSHLLTSLADSKGDIQGLRGLFDLINGTIEYTGSTVGWLSDRWYDFNVGIGAVTGALEDFTPSWTAVGMQLRKGNDLTEEYTDKGEGAYRVIRRLNVEVRDHAVALKLAEQATQNAAERTKNYKDWLDRLNGEMANAVEVQLSYNDAVLSAKDGLRQFRDQLNENRGKWDANTEAGNRNLKSLNDQVRKAAEVRDAAIAMGDGSIESQRKAQKEYNDTVTILLAMATQAGLTKQELMKLAGQYKIQVVAEVIGQQAVDWSTQRNKERKAERRAVGGSAFAGRSYIVGDGGRPELFVPDENGTIMPSVPAAAGGGKIQLAVDLRVNGRTMRQELINDALARGVSQRTVSAAYP